MKDGEENAVESVTSGWRATPHRDRRTTNNSRRLKRKTRKQWKSGRTLQDKKKLNRVTRELKNLLYNLKTEYFKDLTAREPTDYLLWKAKKRIKRP